MIKMLGLLLLLVVCSALPVCAATWHVDASIASSGDGTTWASAFRAIQEGIDAASNGDTVLVAQGTYVENIKFNGKNIILTSTDPSGPDVVAATIIDGGGKGSVVAFAGTENQTCVLSGFTLLNGTGTMHPVKANFAGGGIYGGAGPAGATIENNVITGNSAGYGGGIFGCSGLIRDNLVTANSARGDLPVNGGGGLAFCDGTLQGNTVSRNSVFRGRHHGYGGGLYRCNGRIENNTVTENSAQLRGAGLAFCDGTIENNTISANSAAYGGGLYYCDGVIHSNTITRNQARSDGGGLQGCGGAIENNIISGNEAMYGGGLADCGGAVQNNAITYNSASAYGGGLRGCEGMVQNNLVMGNSAGSWGGGLCQCHNMIEGNTISGNSAEGAGGGLCECRGTIQNNLITGNSATDGGGLQECDGFICNNTACDNRAEHGSGLNRCNGTIINCIIWGNRSGSQLLLCSEPAYSCIERWSGGGVGNIAYYPYFLDSTNGDYHLKSWSPCIDAGDPASAFSGEPVPNGGRIDMGAYGNTPEATSKSPDSDGDELPDDWEIEVFGDLAQAGLDDADGDRISNAEEWHRGFNPTVPAATRHVDGSVAVSGDGTSWNTAFKTIQEGIDAASDGDSVIVAEGRYVENIFFNGKNIVLRSTDPLSPSVVAHTIIDGNKLGSVVTFSGAEDESCVLEGFTIRNGKAEAGGGICGGTWGDCTHATIRNNVITGNSASHGGGIRGCDGLIQENVISANVAPWGGGLSGCGGIIEDNSIIDNLGSSGGAGLYACHGIICHNVIARNSTELYGETRGGGLSYCHGTIQSNIISLNSGDFGGGLGYCHGTIRNNVIVRNTARSGGGLYECGALIENNTVVENSAGEAGGIGYCFECLEHYEGVVKNCIVWGNVAKSDYQVSEGTDITFSCIQEWMGGGEGNISLTPHFVDAWGADYHLQSWSPCIDAGDPSSPFANEPEPNGGRVNMGAYGNTPGAASKSEDSDSDGLPDDWETYWFSNIHHGEDDDPDRDLIPNFREYRFAWDPTAAAGTTAWNLTTGARYETIQSALWESTDGDEILVYPGLYRENIRFLGRNVVLRSTVPTDAGVVAKTIIDGMGKGPVVAFVGTESEMCVLSGFMITNGEGGVWGGYVSTWGWDPPRYTHATIQNNTIACNSGSGVAYSNGVIRNNLITHNAASYGGGLDNCGGTIENNVISNNHADEYGGGLYYCSGWVRSNTIVGNRADKGGDGIHGSAGLVRNCILWGNSGSQVSGTPTYCCIEGWTEGGEGNIAEEPRFVKASSGNLRLMPDSPCIDAGFNAPDLPEFDIAGMHRVMFGGKSLTVDMGAYEFYINRLDPVPATDEAVLTWSSLWPKSYSICYSDDLVIWHMAVSAIPSAGNETTSWTDDGSLTGLPPLLAPRRFYRFIENP